MIQIWQPYLFLYLSCTTGSINLQLCKNIYQCNWDDESEVSPPIGRTTSWRYFSYHFAWSEYFITSRISSSTYRDGFATLLYGINIISWVPLICSNHQLFIFCPSHHLSPKRFIPMHVVLKPKIGSTHFDRLTTPAYCIGKILLDATILNCLKYSYFSISCHFHSPKFIAAHVVSKSIISFTWFDEF